MRIAVDRIEGERALLDVGGEMVEIPAAALPEGAGEGSLLKIELLSPSEAREAAEARLRRLKEKNPPKTDFNL